MARKRSSSSSIARERLKLVLIHDRAGTSPSSNVMEMLRKDIIGVISKYFDVEESDFDVEITNSANIQRGSAATQLSANIRIKRFKSLGPNRY